MSKRLRRGVTRGWLPAAAALLLALAVLSLPLRPRAPSRSARLRPLPTPQPRTLPRAPSWRLAFVRGDDIWTANPDGSDPRRVIRGGHAPCWAPDKHRIAFERAGNVWVANADGTAERQVTDLAYDGNRAGEIQIAWDPVDDVLTFSCPVQYRLATLFGRHPVPSDDDAFTGTAIFDVPATAARVRYPEVRFDIYESGTGFLFSDHIAPAWSRPGRVLAFVRNGDIWVAIRRGGRWSEDLSFSQPPDRPAGRRTPGDWAWDVTRLAAPATFDAPSYRASRENHSVTRLSWSSDERSLVYGIRRVGGSGFEEARLLRVNWTEDGAPWAEIREDRDLDDCAMDPCFAPDGSKVACWTYATTDHEDGIRFLSIDRTPLQGFIEHAEQPAW